MQAKTWLIVQQFSHSGNQYFNPLLIFIDNSIFTAPESISELGNRAAKKTYEKTSWLPWKVEKLLSIPPDQSYLCNTGISRVLEQCEKDSGWPFNHEQR